MRHSRSHQGKVFPGRDTLPCQAPCLFFKTAMNSCPDDLSFFFRVGNPIQFLKKQLRGIQRWISHAVSVLEKAPLPRCFHSFLRSPLSTNIHDKLSPMARWRRTAVTEESTPPRKTAYDTFTAYFLLSDRSRFCRTKDSMVQEGAQPHTLKRKLFRIVALRRMRNFRVELHPEKASSLNPPWRPRGCSYCLQ